MLEIEVKAQVDNLDQIEQELVRRGCVFSEPVIQKDHVFIPQERELLHLLPGDNALRIRTTIHTWVESYLFTVKQQTTNPLIKEEKEVSISNAQDMEAIITMLWYKPCSFTEKMRKKTTYQNIEICLDSVVWLGTFIEAELLTETGNADQLQEELFSFLETLGVSRSLRVTEWYDILQYKASQHI